MTLGPFILKLYHQNAYREYAFSGHGPFIVGGQGSDVELARVIGPVLEIKLSAGEIYLSRLGTPEVMVEHQLIAAFDEIPYQEGQVIQLGEYQVKLENHKSETPPPFFAEEFKAQYEALTKKLQAQTAELKHLEKSLQQKERSLSGVSAHLEELKKDKHHLELVLDQLKVEKRAEEASRAELKEGLKTIQREKREAQESIQKLTLEREQLQQHLHKLQLDIREAKGVREQKLAEQKLAENEFKALGQRLTDEELKLQTLEKKQLSRERQIAADEARLAQVLADSKRALEGLASDEHRCLDLKARVQKIQSEMTALEEERKTKEQLIQDAQKRLSDLKHKAGQEEATLKEIQAAIQEKLQEEARISSSLSVLKLEAQSLEQDFARREGQFIAHKSEFERSQKEHAELKYQSDDLRSKLSHLKEEGESQNYRIELLKKEAEHFSQTLEFEKKEAQAKFQQELAHYQQELKREEAALSTLKLKNHELELKQSAQEEEIKRQRLELSQLNDQTQVLKREMSELEKSKEASSAASRELSSELLRLDGRRQLKLQEVHDWEFRLTQTKNQLKSLEEAAQREREQRQSEFEQKLLSEREIMLSEIALVKKKSLTDIEDLKRQKLQEVHLESDRLLCDSRERLRNATLEAQQLEEKAQQARESALKELGDARKEASDLISRQEKKLQAEWLEDKARMKAYLNKKQTKTIRGLTLLTEEHLRKLARMEARSLQKIDVLKRREMKKIAELRDQELSKHQELKDKLTLEVREERKRTLATLQKLRAEQESELEQAKRVALSALNQTKAKTLSDAQDEIKRERDQFERTKEQRLLSALTAVQKILPESSDPQTSDRLKRALKESLEGKFSVETHAGEKILDFNPLKQKAILPVLKKYTLKVAIPTAAVLALALDVASVRTGLLNGIKQALRQNQSASDQYVQKQKAEWQEKNTFNPETSVGYKTSFVDNVLYTTDFVAVMESEAFQNEWILKLHDFITKELELSEDVAISYISSEGTLVKELAQAKSEIHPSFKEQGIKKMQDLETTHLGWLPQKVSDPKKLERFIGFRKDAYEKFYESSFKGNRSMASDPQAPAVQNLLKP